MHTVKALLLIFAVLLGPTVAHAFSYDESVSGDLVDFETPVHFDFEAGGNVISGSTFIAFAPEDQDFDAFAFTLPTGLELTLVVLSFSALTMDGPWVTISITPQLASRDPGGTWFGVSNFISTATVPIFTDGQTEGFFPQTSPVELNLMDVAGGIVTDTPTLPLGGGPYVFYAGPPINASYYSGPSVSVSWDYSFSFIVTPEPGTGLLVGLGLIGLGHRTRRGSSRS